MVTKRFCAIADPGVFTCQLLGRARDRCNGALTATPWQPLGERVQMMSGPALDRLLTLPYVLGHALRSRAAGFQALEELLIAACGMHGEIEVAQNETEVVVELMQQVSDVADGLRDFVLHGACPRSNEAIICPASARAVTRSCLMDEHCAFCPLITEQ